MNQQAATQIGIAGSLGVDLSLESRAPGFGGRMRGGGFGFPRSGQGLGMAAAIGSVASHPEPLSSGTQCLLGQATRCQRLGVADGAIGGTEFGDRRRNAGAAGQQDGGEESGNEAGEGVAIHGVVGRFWLRNTAILETIHQ